jgi:hypothetical protein
MAAKKGFSLPDDVVRTGSGSKAEGVPQRGGERVSLTLRLDRATYKRLARFAVEHDQKHQAVLETALRQYLDQFE